MSGLKILLSGIIIMIFLRLIYEIVSGIKSLIMWIGFNRIKPIIKAQFELVENHEDKKKIFERYVEEYPEYKHQMNNLYQKEFWKEMKLSIKEMNEAANLFNE